MSGCLAYGCVLVFPADVPLAPQMNIELFSRNTTSHKDHFKVCLPNNRLLTGIIGMWSSMKITLIKAKTEFWGIKGSSAKFSFFKNLCFLMKSCLFPILSYAYIYLVS